MLWLSDPGLAFEHGMSSLLILACKSGPWLVWPTLTVILNRRSQ